jgi:hypothetical protein
MMVSGRRLSRLVSCPIRSSAVVLRWALAICSVAGQFTAIGVVAAVADREQVRRCVERAGQPLTLDRCFSGVEDSASGFTLARTCISVNLSSLKVMDSNRWRVPHLGP